MNDVCAVHPYTGRIGPDVERMAFENRSDEERKASKGDEYAEAETGTLERLRLGESTVEDEKGDFEEEKCQVDFNIKGI